MFGIRTIIENVQTLIAMLNRQFEIITEQSLEIGKHSNQIEKISRQTEDLKSTLDTISNKSDMLHKLINELNKKSEGEVQAQQFSEGQLIMINHHYRRNILPNDEAALQKCLVTNWQHYNQSILSYSELYDSGFRVFSQNDEDGILLRIFSHIMTDNKYIVEIGSNCSGSDVGIPENMSTNLIVNHGWHGSIFELDEIQCQMMGNFFANHLSTKHYHCMNKKDNYYYSPRIYSGSINSDNINKKLKTAGVPHDIDLMIIDIDGGDYSVIKALDTVYPKVLVVEFEKRFRDRYSVVQFNSENFSKNWAQSGATSLLAWERLLKDKNYILCAINSTGFNAFFIREDIANNKFQQLSATNAFDLHPVFSKMPEEFWIEPDDSWEIV